MKNEYQEALDRLAAYNLASADELDNLGFEYSYDDIFADLQLIKQLIDKLPYWLELEERDKPIKPTHIENNRYSCGNCFMSFTIPKVRFVNNQFCGVCGQKIDWNDEE